MNYLIHSSPLKKGVQVLLSLLLMAAALGNGVVHASGSCVHPTGAGHCFASIQEAVDAASDGEEITIRPGKYVEQVTIVGKNLTLVGRRGAVIQAPEGMADTLSAVTPPDDPQEGRPIILVAEAEVTLRDLVIDGRNSGANNPFLYGIAFINADGMIRGNVVKNIGYGEATVLYDEYGYPVFPGEAILVVNFGATPRTVTLKENLVSNYNSSGITVFAQASEADPTLGALTAHVGANNVLGQWGIFFGGYNSAQMTGSVKGNRIRDLITVDQYPAPGTAINTKDLFNVEISDNVVENVDIGFVISGGYTQVLENRFRKASTGILLFVEAPAYYGGSAIGTVLEDNKFDNVYLDLMTTSPDLFPTAAAKSMSEASPETIQPKRLPR
jgi:hypothetical protein